MSFAIHKLEISGADSRDYLHRLTTLDFRTPKPEGAPRLGFFLNALGKIRAVFWVKELGPTTFTFYVPTPPPGAAAFDFKRLLLETMDQTLFTESVAIKEVGTIDSNSEEAKALPSFSMGTLESFENLTPQVGFEITPDANPLELGLGPHISDQKGCYPGQEVIERILTQGAPPRKLSLIVSDAQSGEKAPKPGDPIQIDQTQIGVITSCISLAGGKYKALGLIKKTHANSNTKTSVGTIEKTL